MQQIQKEDVLFLNPTREQTEKLLTRILKETESRNLESDLEKNPENNQMMTQSQYALIMRHLDALQIKADKALLINPDEISTVISLVYIFAKPVIEDVPV